ncbi:MAG: amidophosphoribosyltransferase [Candidatus Aenigmatarchaeota archaeon]
MGCGTAGCVGKNASFFVYHQLLQLQHRGEDSTKILSFDNRHYEHGGVGLVPYVFNEDNIKNLKGSYAIGQVRYPTVGVYDDPSEKMRDTSPIWTDTPCFMALSHNGDMPRALYDNMREKLEKSGEYFKTNSELEIMEKFIAKGLRDKVHDGNFDNEGIFDSVKFMMERVPAAYSVTGIIAKGGECKLVGFSDPQKIRPLVYGKGSNLQLFASESAAIDVLGNYLDEDFETYELKGGEVIIAQEGKEPVKRRLLDVEPKHCFFEYTYFSRPDSVENGVSVYDVRFKLGQSLGRRNTVKADLVTPTPNSGKIYDEGVSAQTGIKNVEVWYKNPYSGRAFIRPPKIRREVSKTKLNLIGHLVAGKIILDTEDSIVRGTNSVNDNETLRRYGVKEIHGLIGTPPLVNPCDWGVDMKESSKFIAKEKTVEEIAKCTGYDSLKYSTVEELVDAIGLPKEHLCMQCIGCHGPKFDHIIDSDAKA